MGSCFIYYSLGVGLNGLLQSVGRLFFKLKNVCLSVFKHLFCKCLTDLHLYSWKCNPDAAKAFSCTHFHSVYIMRRKNVQRLHFKMQMAKCFQILSTLASSVFLLRVIFLLVAMYSFHCKQGLLMAPLVFRFLKTLASICFPQLVCTLDFGRKLTLP